MSLKRSTSMMFLLMSLFRKTERNHQDLVLTISTMKSDTVVVPNKEVWDYAYDFWRLNMKVLLWEQKYVEFKKDIQKEVNYLVKEFECKKSADSYVVLLPLVLVFLIPPNFTPSNSTMIFSRKQRFYLMARIMA